MRGLAQPWGIGIAILLILGAPEVARAHPMVEHALDVVISPDRVTIDARIAMEQVMLVEGRLNAPADTWPDLMEGHGGYVLKHLRLKVDGRPVVGRVVSGVAPKVDGAAGGKMAQFRIEYPTAHNPGAVRLDQDMLRDFQNWSASAIVRIRQSDQATFQTALLTWDKSVEFGCEWIGVATTRPATRTALAFWPTARDYFVHGVGHIIGPIGGGRWDWRNAGIDHLLFVSALVLATARLRDLVLIVSAFTLAHTITLTLCVLNFVTLSDRVVEPIIAGSIVFVAVQNVFWPSQSKGRARLVVAFAFGLFHGLGFAGALKEAMAGLPGSALGAALGGFGFGVEAGHQIVVLPLFALLYAARNYRAARPRTLAVGRVVRFGSLLISMGGLWFLYEAVTQTR